MTDLMAEYYRQRASAGLILTEASPICAGGHGYPRTPGIHTPDYEKLYVGEEQGYTDYPFLAD